MTGACRCQHTVTTVSAELTNHNVVFGSTKLRTQLSSAIQRGMLEETLLATVDLTSPPAHTFNARQGSLRNALFIDVLIYYYLFKTNDKGRLEPLTCHKNSMDNHHLTTPCPEKKRPRYFRL